MVALSWSTTLHCYRTMFEYCLFNRC